MMISKLTEGQALDMGIMEAAIRQATEANSTQIQQAQFTQWMRSHGAGAFSPDSWVEAAILMDHIDALRMNSPKLTAKEKETMQAAMQTGGAVKWWAWRSQQHMTSLKNKGMIEYGTDGIWLTPAGRAAIKTF